MSKSNRTPLKNIYTILNQNCFNIFSISNIFDSKISIELNNKSYVKEWKKEVRIMLEEAGIFEKEGFKYVNGRQEKILLIGR